MYGTSAPPIDAVLAVVVGFTLSLCDQLVSLGLLVKVKTDKSSSSAKQIAAPTYKSRVFDIYNTRRYRI
jgi:hypothetical protein